MRGNRMRNELTEKDIQKMEEEIEYRKLVVRREAIEAVKEARAQKRGPTGISVRTSSIMRRRRIRTRMRAGSGTWRG